MGRYRKVDPRIWNDLKFSALTDAGKLVFFFLLTHPNMTALGAMRHSIPGMAAELGWRLEAFQEAFQEATSEHMVRHDSKACLVWLPNFIKYNRPESPNVVKSWGDSLELLPECPLLLELIKHVKEYILAMPKAFGEALPEAFAKAMPNQEQEQEQEQDLRDTPSDEGVLSSEPPATEDASSTERPERGTPSLHGRNGQPAQADPETGKSAPKRAQDRTPHEAIVALYHEILPMCPRVKVWNPEQKTRLRTRWNEDEDRQSLDWWRWFFQRVAASDWLTGRVKDFVCDLDWLVGPKNMAKVLNGRYDNRGPRTGSRQTDRNVRAAQAFIQGD